MTKSKLWKIKNFQLTKAGREYEESVYKNNFSYTREEKLEKELSELSDCDLYEVNHRNDNDKEVFNQFKEFLKNRKSEDYKEVQARIENRKIEL